MEIIRYAREKMPGLSITSDVIVGFPGETYEEFQDTLSLIREVGFTALYTFIFSPRKGTPAAGMPDPVSHKEKTRWFAELLKVQEEISSGAALDGGENRPGPRGGGSLQAWRTECPNRGKRYGGNPRRSGNDRQLSEYFGHWRGKLGFKGKLYIISAANLYRK